MKPIFLLLLSAICSLSLNAGTHVSGEPVKADEATVALYFKTATQDRRRSPALNAPTFFGYYSKGMFSCDMLSIAGEDTNCIVTVYDTVISTTVNELHQGIYIGEYDSAEIEIQIPYVGIYIGVL